APEVLILTCEHASNRVPPAYRVLFRNQRAILKTHRGYDIGALPLARHLARRLHAPLFVTEVTRLLVEVNRSTHHPELFSEFSENLPPPDKDRVLDAYYHPHRERVEFSVGAHVDQGAQVIHVGVHSFTPVLDSVVRDADIGLLYDPARSRERAWCGLWRDALHDAAPHLRVRRNYPYRGASDGLTTYLRTRFPEDRYLGIELEVNQALFQDRASAMAIRKLLTRTIPSPWTQSSPNE